MTPHARIAQIQHQLQQSARDLNDPSMRGIHASLKATVQQLQAELKSLRLGIGQVTGGLPLVIGEASIYYSQGTPFVKRPFAGDIDPRQITKGLRQSKIEPVQRKFPTRATKLDPG